MEDEIRQADRILRPDERPATDPDRVRRRRVEAPLDSARDRHRRLSPRGTGWPPALFACSSPDGSVRARDSPTPSRDSGEPRFPAPSSFWSGASPGPPGPGGKCRGFARWATSPIVELPILLPAKRRLPAPIARRELCDRPCSSRWRCGLPAIISENMGGPEIVEDGTQGYSFRYATQMPSPSGCGSSMTIQIGEIRWARRPGARRRSSPGIRTGSGSPKHSGP